MKIIRPVTVTDTGTFTRASTATYFDSTGTLASAAINTPRFNYQPNNLAAGPILLVEAAATNEAFYSRQLDNAYWTTSLCTVTADQIAGLDNTVYVDKLVSTAAGNAVVTRAGLGFGIYTLSAVFKAGSSNLAFLSTSIGSAVFNVSTGVVQSVTGGTAKITQLANSLYLCEYTSASTLAQQVSAGMVSAVIGDTIYVSDVQYEQGSKATSRIVTTSASVTRSADVNTAMLISNILENDYATWLSTTFYIKGDRVLDLTSHKVYESSTGVTGAATLTIASPGTVAIPSVAILPVAGTPIKFSTTGALPTGLVAGTTYYVLAVTALTFTVSATVGGAAIAFTGSQSGVHTAVATSNVNKVVTDTTGWTYVGYDNRWSMFDQSITSQSINASGIVVAITPGSRFDSIVGLNCGAYVVTVNVNDPLEGIVFSTRQLLVSDSGITNWYDYFFSPVEYLTDFLIGGIPAGYSSATITVSITSVSGSPAIGGLIVGLSREIGNTESNAKVGTVDYTVKAKDAFGNYTVTPRAFSKRADFTIRVPTSSVDSLQALLTTYRSVPVVYIGSNDSAKEQYRSTIIYGFYKDFSIDISYPPLSTCTLQVEGLT